METPNLRDMVVGPGKAKDFRDTKVLDGEATGKTGAEKATNETKEYSTGKAKGISGPGGRNSGT